MDATTMLAWCGGAVAAAGAVVAHGVFWPRSRLFGPVVGRGSTSSPPRMALTFDDGPHPDATPAILDILARYEAPAAFFVIGANVRQWPQVVRRAHDAGHLICNHSDDHDWGGGFHGRAYWRGQLQQCGDAVVDAIGRRPALFRPPMGIKQPLLAAAVRRCGLQMVTWTRRGLDGLPIRPHRIAHRLLAHPHGGDVLALHDGCEPGRRRSVDHTIAVLPAIITGLRERGLMIVRLDELLAVPAYLPDWPA